MIGLKGMKKTYNASLMQYKHEHIILFDGECMLCNKAIQYILTHDYRNRFYFATLQSEFGQQLLLENKLSTTQLSTVMYLEKGKLYTKSTAAIRAYANLGGFKKSALCLFVFPRFLRDAIYNLVANNRHRFFRNNQCMVQSKELKERML